MKILLLCSVIYALPLSSANLREFIDDLKHSSSTASLENIPAASSPIENEVFTDENQESSIHAHLLKDTYNSNLLFKTAPLRLWFYGACALCHFTDPTNSISPVIKYAAACDLIATTGYFLKQSAEMLSIYKECNPK